MTTIAMDLETFKFAPGWMAPTPVCCSWAQCDASGLMHMSDAESWAQIKRWLVKAGRKELALVGHHVCYDLACLCANAPDPLEWYKLAFAAYDANGIEDTEIRDKLLDIAAGHLRGYEDDGGRWVKHSYHLADVAERRLGISLPKPKDIRTGYGDLYDKPIKEWPPEAVDYALRDAETTLACREAQEAARIVELGDALEDQHRQAAKSFALHLCGAWGLRTDKAGVEALQVAAEAEKERLGVVLASAGLLRPNGSRDTKKAMEIMREVWPDGPTTETGRTCIDENACKESGHPTMLAWAEYAKAQGTLSRKVPMLAAGIDAPIHTYFDSLVASGRASSSAPNINNLDRASGPRECFVPRLGNLFAACDYDKAELHALAQCCKEIVGWSRLGDALGAGNDPHLMLAAEFLGLTYEEAKARKAEPKIKAARQSAKAINFGVPGGLGADSIRSYAKQSYDVELSPDEAVAWREKYLDTFPEMREYFKHMSNLVGSEGEATMRQIYSNRIRGKCRYTVACNTLFQGLCADFAGAALYEVARAEYASPGNSLYGCRTVNFVHDEIMAEVPDDPELAHAAAMELQRIMCEAARPWTPDFPVKASVVLMRRWSKKAEPVWKDCLLIPWEPA